MSLSADSRSGAILFLVSWRNGKNESQECAFLGSQNSEPISQLNACENNELAQLGHKILETQHYHY